MFSNFKSNRRETVEGLSTNVNLLFDYLIVVLPIHYFLLSYHF
jgi:hypothetical protein